MNETKRSQSWLSRLFSRWRGQPPAHSAPAAAARPASGLPPSRGVPPGLANFLLKMPKVELAANLVGSLRPASLLSLVKKYGVDLPADDEPGVRRWFRYRGAEHHAEVEAVVGRALRDPQDFHVLTLDLLAEQAIQNVAYSEVHFDAMRFLSRGVEARGLLQALAEAIRDGEKRLGVSLRFIVELERSADEKAARQTLEWSRDEADVVVAIALVGEEPAAGPADWLDPLWAAAAEHGFKRIARPAGDAGPAAIRTALALAPDRLEHVMRAAEDEALLAELEERQIPVVAALSAAVARGTAPDFARHPFDRLYRAGIPVSISTAGAQLFATNLPREYLGLYGAFGYDPAQLTGLALNALRCSFLPEAERRRREDDFRDGFNSLGERHLGKPILPVLP